MPRRSHQALHQCSLGPGIRFGHNRFYVINTADTPNDSTNTSSLHGSFACACMTIHPPNYRGDSAQTEDIVRGIRSTYGGGASATEVDVWGACWG